MSTLKQCSTCGTEETRMKWCGKCKVTFYCSRECQTRDWKQHKKSCIPPPVTQNGSESGARSGNTFWTASGSSTGTKWKPNQTRVFDHMTGRPIVQEENHFPMSVDDHKFEPLPMELQFLVDKVKSSLPSNSNFFQLPSNAEFRFVTDFEQIQSESAPDWDPDPGGTTVKVLVAKIVELDVCRFHHKIYIADENYSQLVVYFPNKVPVWPYFKLSQLKPGNFICIQSPRLLVFIGGQTGFRVDNPNSVRIVFGQGICLSGK